LEIYVFSIENSRVVFQHSRALVKFMSFYLQNRMFFLQIHAQSLTNVLSLVNSSFLVFHSSKPYVLFAISVSCFGKFYIKFI